MRIHRVSKEEEPQEELLRAGYHPDDADKSTAPADWDRDDIQMCSVWNENTVRKFLGLPRDAVVYKALIPLGDLRERLVEEEDPEGGTYDWSELNSRRTNPPPIVVIRKKDKTLSIADGNHRVRYWTERGYHDAMAWVYDELITDHFRAKKEKTASISPVVKMASEVDRELEALRVKMKDFKSPKDFEAAHTQESLTDLSNHDAHRIGRAFQEDNVDSVANIKKNLSPNGYLETMRQSNPDVWSAVMNARRTIKVYRAVPPTKTQLISFFEKEKAKILHYGNRAMYQYMAVVGIKDTSRYYEFLIGEIEKINNGTTSFLLLDDNSIKIGDLVALTPSYARMHGESHIVWSWKYPMYAMVTKTVPQTDVIWDQADFNEWVYSPQSIRDQYPGGLRDFYVKNSDSQASMV
jgi:hypothetical protein